MNLMNYFLFIQEEWNQGITPFYSYAKFGVVLLQGNILKFSLFVTNYKEFTL